MSWLLHLPPTAFHLWVVVRRMAYHIGHLTCGRLCAHGPSAHFSIDHSSEEGLLWYLYLFPHTLLSFYTSQAQHVGPLKLGLWNHLLWPKDSAALIRATCTQIQSKLSVSHMSICDHQVGVWRLKKIVHYLSDCECKIHLCLGHLWS